MKNSKSALIVAMVGLLAGASANASVADMAGAWNGIGAAFTLDGIQQGSYQVVLVDTLQADGSVKGNLTVTTPGEPVKHFESTMRDSGHGFTMTMDQGSGGATCVGDGLCEGYFGDSNGNGIALTIVKDGPNNFRMLKTQLQNFRAVSLDRETYVRTQPK